MSEHKILKGFNNHYAAKHIYVSRLGEVYNDRTGEFLKHSNIAGAYPNVNISGRSFKLHRLLAEVYLELPTNIRADKLIVNHIDGDKTNFRLSNLEWTDHSGNIIHAYKTNLRTDNRPVMLKNAETLEEHEFYSLQESARFLGVNGAKVCIYLNNNVVRGLLMGKYVGCYKGHPYPDIETAKRTEDIAEGRDVVVKHLPTGKVWIFPSLTAAADFCGETGYTLKKYLLLGEPRSDINSEYEYELLKDWKDKLDAAIRVSKPEKAKPKARKPRAVSVVEMSTSIRKVYDSIHEFATEQGVKKATMEKHIWRTMGIWNGKYRVEYINKR